MPQKALPLSMAQAGMVLAKPACNDKGMVLCKEGTELTENLIERLGRFGIDMVTIEDDHEVTPDEIAARLGALERRFAQVAPEGYLGRLKGLLIERWSNPPS
ncbi:hypothetical protein KDL45_00865 [bacterium]|nr:hypothetical protein [bacterium]